MGVKVHLGQCHIRCHTCYMAMVLHASNSAGCPRLQALFCQVPAENVLTMHDVSNIWRIPLLMQSQHAHKTILDTLRLPHYAEKLDMHTWKTHIADRYGCHASSWLALDNVHCLHVCVVMPLVRGLLGCSAAY
eukprot:GHUV01040475.1.p1 GENE.GHUV01040475.1~~GHUV01040475.1.p1  ORF type:complete len:133 (-),score=22.64 GHUV01040475.1:591-989(-)